MFICIQRKFLSNVCGVVDFVAGRKLIMEVVKR